MSPSQLVDVMNAAVDAVVLIDASGTIQMFNRAAEQMFGWAAEEACGQDIGMLMPEPDRSAHAGYITRHLRTGESRVIGCGREVCALRRDGTQFHAHLAVGKVTGSGSGQFVGFIRDITAERGTLARLQFERDLANAYLQLGYSILLMLDPQRRIRTISPQACALMGQTAGQLIGRDWGEAAFESPLRGKLHEQLDGIESTPSDQVHEFELPILSSHSGTRIVQWRCSVLRDPAGGPAGFICAGWDVTAQRQEEDEASRYTQRMMQVSRMATMGEMAAGIAHELNQPLTAITNYANASARFLDLPEPDLEETREAVREISGEALRAGAIIRRLRHLVRSTDDTYERVEAAELIEDVRLLTQADARVHDTRIRFEALASPALYVHRIQITQVLLNFIRNALESLATHRTGSHEIQVRVRQVAGGDCEFAVCDNGPGVAPEIVDHMFAPFHSTKHNGTGLGLPMSQTIALAHGGNVRYEPVEPHGACFALTIPCVR